MLIQEPVSQWNHPVVIPLITGFVSPDQQDGLSTRVKCVECPERTSVGLGYKLLHVSVSGLFDSVSMGSPKSRPQDLQQFDAHG